MLSSLFGTISHTEIGTDYGEKGVSAYTESNHGPDGNLFLDPYFKPKIENLKNAKVLDAGCGAAPWAIYAAKQGGEVYAIDIQEKMLESAKKAIHAAQLIDRVSLAKGDVAKLPYKDNFFDRIISICVGCNLPANSFEKHFSEIKRTLKEGGLAVIGAPTSLDVVFSNGSKTDAEVFLHIQKVLNELPIHPTSEIISEKLNQLDEVLSATFCYRNDRLVLVANEQDLSEGEKIWRKLPKLVVPNCYYSREHYINMLKKYNLTIEKIELPHFLTESDRLEYNKNAAPNALLGQNYVLHAPFVIFHIKK
jgi:SAM-dependent methyltransferase